MAFKTTAFPALTLALTATLAAAFVMTGCSKNKDDNTQEAPTTWVEPVLPVLYDPNPLFLQASVDPVVFIWQQLPRPQSDVQRYEPYDEDMFFAMMPSRLSDAPSRMESYKIAAEATGRTPTIWLTGDDRALCGSITRLIDDAKRAGIDNILFEKTYRSTGIGNYSYGTSWCGVSEYPSYYDFKSDAKYARKIVTITILADDTIAWEKKSVSLEEFPEKLRDYTNKVGTENAAIVVEVDAKASYQPLRWVLDQMQRCVIPKVMVAPRKAE